MIRMFERGQIDEEELLEMLSEVGEGIIGDFNPITDVPKTGEVESSYFKMRHPIETSQEKPRMVAPMSVGSKPRFVGRTVKTSEVAKMRDTFPTFNNFHLPAPSPPTYHRQREVETSHRLFSHPPVLSYSRPREPFAPLVSLLISSLSPEHRHLQMNHQLPKSQPVRYKKTQYTTYRPVKHQQLPTPRYRKHKGYSSPLYIHHGPRLREIDQTIEDIQKAFVSGDSIGPQGDPS